MLPLPPDRWPEVESLFEAASALAGAQRAALLAAADPAVAAEVRDLLAAEPDAEAYFDHPTDLGPLFVRAPPQDDLEAGSRVGPWLVGAELGRGGMGTVYEARRADGIYDQTVALKVLRRGMDSAVVVRRFEQERSVLAALSHPSIARLIAGGTLPDGRPYFAMERVEGEPVTAYVDRKGLTVRARLGLFLDVCDAVAHAHRALVVHRDLKPSNVLVTDNGAVSLLDFGIAKLLEIPSDTLTLTGDGPRPYTPDFAAPEQIDGRPVTTATDVYALGLLLSALIGRPRTGTTGPNVAGSGLLSGHPSGSPAPSGIATTSSSPTGLRRVFRGDLDAICRKALRSEPDARYPTVDAFAADVRRHLAGRPVAARQGSARYNAASFIRRHRWGAAATTALVAMLVGFAGLTAAQNRRVVREAEKARAVAALLEDIFLEIDPGGRRGGVPTLHEVLDAGVVQVQAIDGDPEVKSHLLDVMARVFRALADYDRALPLQQEAVRLLDDGGDPSPAELLTRHHLAYLREQMGALEEAEREYRAVLVARRASGDPDGLVESTSDFAGLMLRLGQFGEAEALAREGLAVLDRHPEAGPPDLGGALARAGFLTLLGRAVAARGQTAEGERLLREAIALFTRERGPHHTYTAAAGSRLALNLAKQGRYEEADRLFARAVAAQERAWGPGHPWTLDALLARAAARESARAPVEARAMFQDARRRAEAADDSSRTGAAQRAISALDTDRLAARPPR